MPVAETAGAVPKKPDLAEDLRSRGCPVCRHADLCVSDFFAHWQYMLATDENAQTEFARELGFCPLHTWQLLAISSPHGASVGYARLVELVARRLPDSAEITADNNKVRALLRDSRNCRVCEMIRRNEKEYTQRLATLIRETAGRDLYRRSQGVCLRHLGMLIDAGMDKAARQFLLNHAAQRFEEDAEDMQSFAIKHEALRRGLQNRNEQDAYRRAAVRIVGERSVCVPWHEDGQL